LIPDLLIDRMQRWNQPARRRYGFHHAHEMFRQSLAFRSGQTLRLAPAVDGRISQSPGLAALIENRAFSACMVVRGDSLLFEVYVDDFPVRQPHSIQSITKTPVYLMLGQAVASGATEAGEHVDQQPERSTRHLVFQGCPQLHQGPPRMGRLGAIRG
jgi:hypothetical protein